MLKFILTLATAKTVYENYSFDYSAHKMPLAYTTYGNAVELNHKVKLNSVVAGRGGAYVLDRAITLTDFEIMTEFQINTPVDQARGFQLILDTNPFREEWALQSHFGYRSDFNGLGIYVFRSRSSGLWHVMTL